MLGWCYDGESSADVILRVQLLRGAGCTVNDMWDRDIDARVERTRYRPLAARVIGYPEATAFLAAQLSLGLAVLVQLNDYSKVLGVSSLLLVATYPLMKRVTSWVRAFPAFSVHLTATARREWRGADRSP